MVLGLVIEVECFFVPCYSEQNGYYSDEIDIRYHIIDSNAVTILNSNCRLVY